MEIKFSNGYAVLKPFVTRGLKKKIKATLYENVEGKMDVKDSRQTFDGISIANMDNANDVALIGMVEKLVINEKEMPVSKETFDNMKDEDCELIIKAIDEMTKKK
ncbi:MAG: hypothetical protein EOL88_00520 [Bacteroidia bacterium]|nr:hypothetical protein [Bacteroidia bacterium]